MSSDKTAVIVGVGPGLGMAMAHRFGREGYQLVLISRGASRHEGYIAELAEAGVRAEAHAVDVRDPGRLGKVLADVEDRHGRVDVLYYGAFGSDPTTPIRPIVETGSADVAETMSWILPAIDAVQQVLPGMRDRGSGGLLFAGGASAVIPFPQLGGVSVMAAALRNYVLTLAAGLEGTGVYAGTLTIGGAIRRGDIYRQLGQGAEDDALDPDDIADTAWRMYVERDSAETVFNALR